MPSYRDTGPAYHPSLGATHSATPAFSMGMRLKDPKTSNGPAPAQYAPQVLVIRIYVYTRYTFILVIRIYSLYVYTPQVLVVFFFVIYVQCALMPRTHTLAHIQRAFWYPGTALELISSYPGTNTLVPGTNTLVPRN